MSHLVAFQDGLLAAKAGKKMVARLQFEQAAELNPDFIHSWLWLAWTADSPEQADGFLTKAGELDPNNRLVSTYREIVAAMGRYDIDNDYADFLPETGARSYAQETDDAPSADSDAINYEANESNKKGVSDTRSFIDLSTYDESQLAAEFSALKDEVQTAITDSSSAAATPVSKPAAPSADVPTILVVDDSPTVRKLVTMTLKSGGYNVETAEDGVVAMKMLANLTPTLILLDVNMPRMDGYKLCKLIKRHEKTKFIPVVMLSGKDGMFDKLRGTLVGCDDYISKPFRSTDLLSHIEKYVMAPSA